MNEAEMMIEQLAYIELCKEFGIPEFTEVDCGFPGIRLGDLRDRAYPELADIIKTNTALFPPRRESNSDLGRF